MLKRYSLHYSTVTGGQEKVPGHTLTMSSFAGTILSTDDFLTINTGLVTTETTISLYNSSLFQTLDPASQLFESVRVMTANRLATTGEEWTEIMARNNGGTYNNQWMVVDNKLFRPHQQQLSPGLFWVLEQIPGYVRRKDLTSVLQTRTFWPSYNSPYFTGESLSNNPSTDPVIQTFSTRVETPSLSRSTETGFHTIKLQERLYSPGM